LKEAELSLRKAIKLNPDFAMAHSNLGNVLSDIGNLKEAELSLRKAIELNPDYVEASANLSVLELLRGDYKNGLENYEFRFHQKKTIIHSKPQINKVDNNKLPKDEKLLIISEQGLGDTLQYMRYIPYLREQGFNVSFCAQEKLHSLIKASNIDPNPLTPEQANQVSEGQWLPLLSLPRYLKINPKNPIKSQPYISSTEDLYKKWEDILSKERRPIIGINWQGNPNAEKTILKGRSLQLEKFSTLAKKKTLKLLSLQKGFGSEQLDHCSFKNMFVECQAKVDSTWDFLENAAIIDNCDLIITSDTSIAHLAGAMGKTTWILLKHVPEWRWGTEGESTFWYPSMRLFRQKQRHDWQEVMERVSNKFEEELKKNMNWSK
ncbi:glycosyltransferase family 9 protein, partial [Prochlorococcus marinus]